MWRTRRALNVAALEARETPAVFNIAAGDVAGLSAAISTSNSNAQADTINLATGSIYNYAASVDPADGGNALPTVLLDGVTENGLTINGNGATWQRSADVGTPDFRFLRISVFPGLPSVTINNLTMTNGNAGLLKGGAILLNAGDLSVNGVTFTGNQAAVGGAVYATNTTTTPRTMTLTNSTFVGNSTTMGAGGAVYQLGSTNVNVSNCLFQTNASSAEGGGLRFQSSSAAINITGSTFAQNNANGGGGAGLFVQGVTTVTESTVRDNTASTGGAGIWVQSSSSFTMRGTTVSGNRANGPSSSGGGIFSQSPATIENSTIHDNRAANGGGIALSIGAALTANITHSTITNNNAFSALPFGGGIRITLGGTANLGHTIIAENVLETGSGTGPDLTGTFNSLGFNLIGNTAGATINGSTTSNITGVSPNLGVLQNNGGPTFTRRPNAGSPVINAGDPAFVAPPGTDQRGPGFTRVGGGRVDIGAFENNPALVANVQINDGSPQRSRVTSLTVTFNQPVSLPGNAADAFELKRQGNDATVTMNANVVGSTVTLTFVSGPVDFGSLADGRYTLKVLNQQVNGGDFDGNGDGTIGDDFVLASALAPLPASNIFRLFGDADGNGTVNAGDFAAFRSVFGLGASFFDFNNDGNTNAVDFGQFRARFGLTI